MAAVFTANTTELKPSKQLPRNSTPQFFFCTIQTLWGQAGSGKQIGLNFTDNQLKLCRSNTELRVQSPQAESLNFSQTSQNDVLALAVWTLPGLWHRSLTFPHILFDVSIPITNRLPSSACAQRAAAPRTGAPLPTLFVRLSDSILCASVCVRASVDKLLHKVVRCLFFETRRLRLEIPRFHHGSLADRKLALSPQVTRHFLTQVTDQGAESVSHSLTPSCPDAFAVGTGKRTR